MPIMPAHPPEPHSDAPCCDGVWLHTDDCPIAPLDQIGGDE